MKKYWYFLFFFFLVMQNLFSSHVYHHDIQDDNMQNNTYVWTKEDIPAFDEIITSWNLHRPRKGVFQIYVSLQIEDKGWTPYILYAEWGTHDQKTFAAKLKEFGVTSFQHFIGTSQNNLGTGFRIKILAKGEASLLNILRTQEFDKNYNSLHACTINTSQQLPKPFDRINYSILLPVTHLSQFELRSNDGGYLCSPTSITTVINYLLKSNHLDPLKFAKKVKDSQFNIYGNWVLNVAQAFQELGIFESWITKLSGLNDIIKYLQKDIPIIISIREAVSKNPPYPYNSGHSIVIIGYDHQTNEFLCMDPGRHSKASFPSRYSSEKLQKIWGNRGYAAYLFRKRY